MGEPVRVTTENEVATVLLNRPETFNAFNLELARDPADRLGRDPDTYKASRPAGIKFICYN